MPKRYKPLSKRAINKMSTDELIWAIFNLGGHYTRGKFPKYKLADVNNMSDEIKEIKERCGD